MRGITLRPTTVGMVLPAGGVGGLATGVVMGSEKRKIVNEWNQNELQLTKTPKKCVSPLEKQEQVHNRRYDGTYWSR